MGIGDLKKLVAQLTKLPIVVMNSHTHNDHVGDNWQFATIYAMDTDFTRQRRGPRETHKPRSTGEICGDLPNGFDRKSYATQSLEDRKPINTMAIASTWAAARSRSSPHPATRPTPSVSSMPRNGLLFTGDTYYPGPIWLYRPKPISTAYDASITSPRCARSASQDRPRSSRLSLAPPSVLPAWQLPSKRPAQARSPPFPEAPEK